GCIFVRLTGDPPLFKVHAGRGSYENLIVVGIAGVFLVLAPIKGGRSSLRFKTGERSLDAWRASIIKDRQSVGKCINYDREIKCVGTGASGFDACGVPTASGRIDLRKDGR